MCKFRFRTTEEVECAKSVFHTTDDTVLWAAIVEASGIGYTRVFRRRPVGFFPVAVGPVLVDRHRSLSGQGGTGPGRRDSPPKQRCARSYPPELYASLRAAAIRSDKVGAKRVAAISRKPSGVVRQDGYKRLHDKLGHPGSLSEHVYINYTRVSPQNDSATGVLHHSYTPRYCAVLVVQTPSNRTRLPCTTRPPNIGRRARSLSPHNSFVNYY